MTADVGTTVRLDPPRATHAPADEVVALRARLGEVEEILRAIRRGEVDAVVVEGAGGERVRTFQDADSAYRVLVEAMPEGAAILTLGGRLLYANGSLARMLRAPLELVMGSSLDRYARPSERAALAALIASARSRPAVGEVMLQRGDGASLPVQLSLTPMGVNGERAICVVAVDMTERNRVEEQLRSLSLTDELTGLYNARGFFALAEQQVRIAQRQGEFLVVLFADLDGLKGINDTLGHAEGSRAIADTASILRHTFRDSDLVARIGGDEFAVLALVARPPDVTAVTERLARRVAAHNRDGGRPYTVSLSVGTTTHDPAVPVEIASLLYRADRAMYEQKRTRSGRIGPEAPDPKAAGPDAGARWPTVTPGGGLAPCDDAASAATRSGWVRAVPGARPAP